VKVDSTRRPGLRRRPPSPAWLGARAVLGLAAVLAAGAVAAGSRDPFAAARERMVRETIEARGIRDPRVLRAMRAVPRHLFVPPGHRDRAYADSPVPIGEGQTVSQPYIVALMTELAEVEPGEKVLEVGTGSGYQAAVLAEMGVRVYTIEIVEPLALRARETLRRLGYDTVRVRVGDGYRGWPAEAPFDAVLVTAAAPRIPEPLLEQLAPGGRLVAPVGAADGQQLVVVTRTPSGSERRTVIPVRFVPMTGEIRGATGSGVASGLPGEGPGERPLGEGSAGGSGQGETGAEAGSSGRGSREQRPEVR